jgi:uncharacterized protein YukE
MPDSAQPSGGQQPEQKSVLGFPVRPEGDGGAVAAGRHHWYELAQEVHGAFADIDRAVASMQWSGDGRRAFDAAWSQFSGHGTEAAQHSQEMGDHLLKLGHQIDDAQSQWDMAMAAMVASTAIGIGLTFVTFGISDAVAEGAAAAAVGTMEAVCAALDISLEAAIQVMIAAIRIGVQLAVKFTWQFGINVVSQEAANVVQGQGLDHVNLLQAAEFAAAATVIPGLGAKVTIGGKQVLQGASGALLTGAATDAGIQGMEAVTEGKPFSPGEVVASGALAMGGQALAGAIGSRMGRTAVPPTEGPPPVDTIPIEPLAPFPDSLPAPARPLMEPPPDLPWVRSLNSAPRTQTQEEQVAWYREHVAGPHAGDPAFQRFDDMVGAWQGGGQQTFRGGVMKVLSGEADTGHWLHDYSQGLVDTMRAAPAGAPELQRGMWIKGDVHDVAAGFQPGGELRLLPSSFSHDPGVAEHFAHADYQQPGQVSVILRQEAGAKSVMIQPMTPNGAWTLWREGEWISGGSYEVTGVHQVGDHQLMVDIRQTGDIGSLYRNTGGLHQ